MPLQPQTRPERFVSPLDFVDQIVAQTPLGRAGTPDDIAKVAVFLASDKAG